MTDTSTDTDAATSKDGSDNTTTNAIIWTTAKAPSSKKKKSSGGGKSSRRRFSSRKKQKRQLTPISKDTATLFKKKSSGAGGRSSRRRRSRRKKQKREFTSELKSNGLLVDEAPTKSKHARGPLFSMGTISMTRKTAFSFLLAVMFALMFISKLLTGILCTVDNDLPAFGCKDSLRSMNADFCFEKLPISASFPSVNYANPKTPRADICGAPPISFQQADEDTPYFLALPNENNADAFDCGCSMDGNSLLPQQKTKNNNGNIRILFGRSNSSFTLLDGSTLLNGNNAGDFDILKHGCSIYGSCLLPEQKIRNNNDTAGLSCGPSMFALLNGNALPNENNADDFDILERRCSLLHGNCLPPQEMKNNNSDIVGLSYGRSSSSSFTLQGRIYFQQNKTWSNNFLGLDIIPFEAILRDWMEKKENETIELKPQSELPRWIPKGAAHSFLQRPAHNNDAQSIAKDILEMGTAGRFLTMTMNIQARDFVEPPRKGSICKQSWPKLSTFKHREASMASAITNLEARNEKAIEVKSPHISARASRSLWRRIVFHVSGAPLCAVQDALLCILESMIFAFYFASFASSIFVFGLMLWRPRIFRP